MSISARINNVNHEILVSMPICCLRRVYIKRFNGTESEQVRAYVVIPKKSEDWASIVEKFYAILSSIKGEDESVGVDGYTFYFKGNGYKILYQIEFWGKRAEMIGYIKDGKRVIASLLRLNSYFAGIKFAKMSKEQREKVYDRIDWYEKQDPSLNVFDRFVYALDDVTGKQGKKRKQRKEYEIVYREKFTLGNLEQLDGLFDLSPLSIELDENKLIFCFDKAEITSLKDESGKRVYEHDELKAVYELNKNLEYSCVIVKTPDACKFYGIDEFLSYADKISFTIANQYYNRNGCIIKGVGCVEEDGKEQNMIIEFELAVKSITYEWDD